MTRILRLLLIAAIALPAWLGTAAETITVCGTSPNTSSEFLPVYGYWMDTQGVETQMIYPSSMFNGLAGGGVNKIDAITFYSKTAVPAALGGKTLIVRMGETYGTTISSRSEMISNRNSMELVYQGELTTGATEVTIEFTTPYVYQGNNILIDFYVKDNSTVTGEHCNWIGEIQQENTAWNSKNGGDSFLPKMTITYSGYQQQVVDFGKKSVGSTSTETITVANVTDYSLSPESGAFTVTKSGDTFTVTFTPAAASSYTGFLTVTVGGKNEVIKLKGIGTGATSDGPVATRDKNFFKEITYEWTDSLNNTHISNLSEIATDPDQIIAMLKKVYTDQSIPGNYYRSNAPTNNNDTYNTVLYTAVGQINSSGNWVDSYGWGIDGTVQGSSYKYFKIDEYKPTEEGVTLLLMEMVDTFKAPDDSPTAATTHDYAKLRTLMRNAIKSARVITEAKRTVKGSDSGTLFKIDCDKMNNFYLLAKGQLLGYNNSGYYHNYAYPHFYNGTWYDHRLQSSYLQQPAFLCHMFEQFSPEVDKGTPKEDLYAQMLDMKSFDVEHDCPNVPYINHHFKMYDSDYSGDCADVRDMMFFVPDNRMEYWNGRDESSSALYHSYNTSHAPSMGMYVIEQDAITGSQVEGKEMYNLTLTWDSNLDEFLPGDYQVYYLYRVEIDEDGTEQYKEVYYMNSDGKYTESDGVTVLADQTEPKKIELEMAPSSVNKTYSGIYIPMLVNSQVVTFAVQGQDATKFLELKMSNKQDFVIPGLDPNEVVNLIDATHYSRFNPKTVENCYSNRIEMKNAGLTHSQIVTSGNENATPTKLDIIRSYVKEDNTVDETIVATITFADGSQGRLNWTVNVNNASQSPSSKYPNGATSGSAAGYHANGTTNSPLTGSTTSRVTQNNPNPSLDLGTNGIRFYDNFTADVSKNDHPSSYSYTMKSNIAGAPAVYLKTKKKNQDDTVTDFTDGAVWYAWNWSTDEDPEFVPGVKVDDDGLYAFFYKANKPNIIFVRMNPNGAPSWNAKWNQTGDLTASDGATYTITKWHIDDNNDQSDLAVSGPVAGDPAVMHSNTYRVPVYKTESEINNVYTLEEVNGDTDGYQFENDELTFKEKVQYSSKKDILRYDVYRWAEGADDWGFIIDKVDATNDNKESDISPNGQADNEDGWYTTKMNADAGESVTVPSGTTNWAVFVDDYPGSVESTQDEQGHAIQGLGIAQAFTYAPVVEVFGKGKTSHSDNTDRTDYNTYGAPLSSAAVGEFEMKEILTSDFGTGEDALMSEHKWVGKDKNNKDVYYSYYNIPLTFTAKEVPADYEIYKIRIWREIDPSVLGEEFAVFQAQGDRDRMTPVRAIGDAYTYLVADITYPDTQNLGTSFGGFDDPQTVTVTQTNLVSGEPYDTEITYTLGTFGARRVRTSDITEEDDDYAMYYDDDIDVGFFARIYFTRADNLTSKAAAEGDYYMVEAETDYTIKVDTDIPTGVVRNLNSREVVGVKYYNTLGIESNRPFDGVNIVVTRYSDGSTTSTKILK